MRQRLEEIIRNHNRMSTPCIISAVNVTGGESKWEDAGRSSFREYCVLKDNEKCS